MPKNISATLLADGSSDHAVLIPLLTLLLDEHSSIPFRISSAESLRVGLSLEQRIPAALALYPCDLLFVHRDAEGLPSEARKREIDEAVARMGKREGVSVPHVCIVPVRMTEAWLLCDEDALRTAVGNPAGRSALSLPAPGRLERVDAKDALFRALEAAADLGARRTRHFLPQQFRHRVAESLSSVAPLRALPSFQVFEGDLRAELTRLV